MIYLLSQVSIKQLTYWIEQTMVKWCLEIWLIRKTHGQYLLLQDISTNLVSVKPALIGFKFKLIYLWDGKKKINLSILYTILQMYEQELILKFMIIDIKEEAITILGVTIAFLQIQLIIILFKTFYTQINQLENFTLQLAVKT